MLRRLSLVWLSVSRILRAAGALVLAAAMLVGCEPPEEPEGELPPGGPGRRAPRPRQNIDKPISPVRVWRETAMRAGVPDKSIDLVERLLLEAVPEAKNPMPIDRAETIAGSLHQFVYGEVECYSEAMAASHAAYVERSWLVRGKAYWTAWLLAEAIKRPAMTAESRAEIREDFSALVSALVEQATAKSAGALRRELWERFDKLHPDMLFPALKKPISAGRREVLVKGAAGKKDVSARELAVYVLFELAYEEIHPRLTEYWGYMKVEGYGPEKPRWPISLAFVPDAERNKARNWRRGVKQPASRTRPRAATSPSRPSPVMLRTAPAPDGVNLTDWSEPVNGLRTRLSVGPYAAKHLDLQVALRFWNVTRQRIELDTDFFDSLTFRLTDASGSEVKPSATGAPAGGADWQYVPPGRTVGKIVGRSEPGGAAVRLTLGTDTWDLKPGKYRLNCEIKVDPDAAKHRKGAWAGQIKLKPGRFEVFGELGDEELARAVAKVKVSHALDSKAVFWQALAELVKPGMTPKQMEIVLAAAAGEKPRIDDRGTYFLIGYPLDAEFAVKAVGLLSPGPAERRVLTSRPVVLRRTPGTPTRPAKAAPHTMPTE